MSHHDDFEQAFDAYEQSFVVPEQIRERLLVKAQALSKRRRRTAAAVRTFVAICDAILGRNDERWRSISSPADCSTSDVHLRDELRGSVACPETLPIHTAHSREHSDDLLVYQNTDPVRHGEDPPIRWQRRS